MSYSAWIDDKNVYSYRDHKDRDAMLKAGKPKALFEKAIEEIENYILNPDVSL